MMRKRFLPFILAAFLAAAAGCSEKIEPGTTAAESARSVKAPVATAAISTWPHVYEAVGTVNAKTSSTISAKMMGTVTAVNVHEGDAVSRGQLMAVIDDSQVNARLRQAQAALAEARGAEAASMSARDAALANAVLARATDKRYQALKQDDSVSQQEFEEVEARRRQADAAFKQAEAMVAAARDRIKQAEAALAAAEVSKRDTRVLAPYDARVTGRMVEPGDLASPGKPFFAIEKKGGAQVEVAVPAAYIEAVSLKQSLQVAVADFSPRPFEGTVSRIVPAADPQSRSFIVKVDLPADANVPSGLFARVMLPLASSRLMLVPNSAIVVQGQLTGLFVVDSEGIGRFRLVRTGRRFEDLIEIVSGLPEGSRYVTAPPPTLTDGARVEAAS